MKKKKEENRWEENSKVEIEENTETNKSEKNINTR